VQVCVDYNWLVTNPSNLAYTLTYKLNLLVFKNMLGHHFSLYRHVFAAAISLPFCNTSVKLIKVTAAVLLLVT